MGAGGGGDTDLGNTHIHTGMCPAGQLLSLRGADAGVERETQEQARSGTEIEDRGTGYGEKQKPETGERNHKETDKRQC